MMSYISRVLFTAFVFALTGTSSFPAEMIFRQVGNGGNCYIGCQWIIAEGEITRDTPKKLSQFLNSDEALSGPIMLNSPGGDIQAAYEMGRIIRADGRETMIGASRAYFENWYEPVEGARCEGACAIAFLGGRLRLAGLRTFNFNYDGQIKFEKLNSSAIVEGISEASVSGNDLLSEQVSIGIFVNYLIEMGVSPELYAALSNVALGQKLTLSRGDAQSYNVETSKEGNGALKLSLLNGGLEASDDASGNLDGIGFYCLKGEKAIRARIKFSRISKGSDGTLLGCSDRMCTGSPGETAFFESFNIGDAKFPLDYVSKEIVAGQPKLLVFEFRLPVSAKQAIARSGSISISSGGSRVSLSNSKLYDRSWNAPVDKRIINLVLKNCARNS